MCKYAKNIHKKKEICKNMPSNQCMTRLVSVYRNFHGECDTNSCYPWNM